MQVETTSDGIPLYVLKELSIDSIVYRKSLEPLQNPYIGLSSFREEARGTSLL